MPLTRKGKEILEKYKKRYGKIKGKSFFYATMKKYPRRTKGWHKVK